MLFMSLASLSSQQSAAISLQPYPTRRSSDLGRHRVPQLDVAFEIGVVRYARTAELAAHAVAERALDQHDGEMRRPRSEEHTSELQSPCNIVCRLLLEKKRVRNIYKQD